MVIGRDEGQKNSLAQLSSESKFNGGISCSDRLKGWRWMSGGRGVRPAGCEGWVLSWDHKCQGIDCALQHVPTLLGGRLFDRFADFVCTLLRLTPKKGSSQFVCFQQLSTLDD